MFAIAWLGLWMRSPILFYDGPATQEAFNDFSFDRFASYSNIASLYFRDALASRPARYFDYSFEYPVGIGLTVFLLSSFAGTPSAYVVVSSPPDVCGGDQPDSV
ncbi:MAG: hypothetical protein M3494_05690 [Actinomycetota bacterium]|nr:hypothetical protein [Actinomycetota bacterium]